MGRSATEKRKVTTTNLTADRSYTKGEESGVSFLIGPQKNAVKTCRALVLVQAYTTDQDAASFLCLLFIYLR